jgi:hypothetical protein
MTREGVTETDDLCVQIYGVNAGPPPANFPPSGGGPGYIPPASINANKPTAESKPTTAKKPVEPVDDGIEVAITSMGSDGINTGNVTYYVEVTNTQDIVENNVVLTIETPEGTTFQTAISPPLIRPSRYASDKRTVEFLPIATLRANEKARFRIVAKRSGGKISRFRAKITSDRISHSPVFSDKTD